MEALLGQPPSMKPVPHSAWWQCEIPVRRLVLSFFHLLPVQFAADRPVWQRNGAAARREGGMATSVTAAAH